MHDPLPEGCYFNGASYVDAFGDRSEFHPLLDEIAEAWVAEQNAAIAAENEKLAVEAGAAGEVRVEVREV